MINAVAADRARERETGGGERAGGEKREDRRGKREERKRTEEPKLKHVQRETSETQFENRPGDRTRSMPRSRPAPPTPLARTPALAEQQTGAPRRRRRDASWHAAAAPHIKHACSCPSASEVVALLPLLALVVLLPLPPGDKPLVQAALVGGAVLALVILCRVV
jgi:hypothetical protein